MNGTEEIWIVLHEEDAKKLFRVRAIINNNANVLEESIKCLHSYIMHR